MEWDIFTDIKKGVLSESDIDMNPQMYPPGPLPNTHPSPQTPNLIFIQHKQG